MGRSRSFVRRRTAIDSGAAGVEGGGGGGGDGGGGGGQAPHGLLGRGSWSQARCWRAERRVTEHCSSPLNPSVTCHTVVIDGERTTVEKREGEEVGRKSCFLFFPFFFTETVTDEESIRPCVTRNKMMIQEKASTNSGFQQIQHHFTCK